MYRKFTAESIFDGTKLLPPNNVLITQKNGTIVEITTAEKAGDDIEFFNGIICPGFVNCHCHLELSHLKGIIPERTGLVDFVFKIITQRSTNAKEIQQAIAYAEKEMLQNGIVAVGDICNTTDTIQQKKLNSLHYQNFIEVTGFVPATAQQRFDAATKILNEFKTLTPKNCSINPHAPYSVSPQLFSLINNYAGNSLITIHNQETPQEDEFFKTGTGDFLKLYQQLGIDISFYKPTGKSSLQTILPFLNKQQQLLLVHDVTTSKEDVVFANHLKESNQLSELYYCLCPNANTYISNSLPNVNHLVNSNCNIVLGTDSLASNHQLSILEEMKTLQQQFAQLPITSLLQWATLNGAKALQMENTLGSFENGKKPGVVLMEGLQNNTITTSTSAKRLL